MNLPGEFIRRAQTEPSNDSCFRSIGAATESCYGAAELDHGSFDVTHMKPGDHPEFYRFPAPAGRSRESSITLDKQGRFFHDGNLVERPSMTEAFFKWLRRHPDNGRYILSNDYDWTYLTVEDAPFFVRSLRIDDDGVWLRLSDGTEEPLRKEGLRVGTNHALYCRVKDGQYEACFTPAAQVMLEPLLEEGAQGIVRIRLGQETAELSPESFPESE